MQALLGNQAKEAKKLAAEVHWVLQRVEVNMPEDVCWLVAQALKKYFETNGGFSQKEAAALIARYRELFEVE